MELKTFEINDLDHFIIEKAIKKNEAGLLSDMTEICQKRFGVKEGYVITDLHQYPRARKTKLKFPFKKDSIK